MSAHLGGSLTAFVDGELDHARRDEVLVHLAHCGPCRAEVELLRGLKFALRGSTTFAAPQDLAARVLAATAPAGQPVAVHRPHMPRGRLHDARWRRSAIGLGALTLGVGAALVVAGPPPAPPNAPMDPTSPGLVIDHVSTANEVPFAGTAVVSVAHPFTAR